MLIAKKPRIERNIDWPYISMLVSNRKNDSLQSFEGNPMICICVCKPVGPEGPICATVLLIIMQLSPQ